MKELIKKINEMFEANPYTNNGRVVVDYSENCNAVVVNVLDKVEAVYTEELTEYGIMFVIMDKVKEMYDCC